MNTSWYRHDPSHGCLILTLHVQPNAGKNAIVGRHGDALKVRIAAPAVDNKANLELVKFLKELLALPASAIVIRHGATSRRKVVEITGGAELAARFERLI
jgi:uncharacterized protein (TIGR00251 family)